MLAKASQIICFFAVMAGIARADTENTEHTLFFAHRNFLSSQISDPYMLGGRVMVEGQPRWHQFEQAIARFPDTSSCLLPEERGEEVQNLLSFDWKAMRSLTEIDVCVWRIASTIDDIQKMRRWLSLQGYSGSDNTQSCDNAVRTPITSESSPFCSVDGGMAIEAFESGTSVFDNMPLLTRWLWRRIARQHSITISYSYKMRVNDVSAGIISE